MDLITRIMWEKWNHRGCYYQDQSGWGSYHTYSKSIDAKSGKWIERPEHGAQPAAEQKLRRRNCAAAALAHHRQPEYRERVEHIFGRGKMLFEHYPAEDRIVWSYWTPLAPFDIDGRAPKHWFGVHPSRPGYQVGEVGAMVEVYD